MKHALILAALLALAACGFRPVHGRDYQAQQDASLSSVQVSVDNTRLGQLLKAEIETGVNPGYEHAEKRYALNITLSENDVYLFVNPDGTAGRGDVVFTSSYQLVRNADRKTIKTGTLKRVSSYNISESADYATYVSEEDARRRGIVELAQDYKLRLANLMQNVNNAEQP